MAAKIKKGDKVVVLDRPRQGQDRRSRPGACRRKSARSCVASTW